MAVVIVPIETGTEKKHDSLLEAMGVHVIPRGLGPCNCIKHKPGNLVTEALDMSLVPGSAAALVADPSNLHISSQSVGADTVLHPSESHSRGSSFSLSLIRTPCKGCLCLGSSAAYVGSYSWSSREATTDCIARVDGVNGVASSHSCHPRSTRWSSGDPAPGALVWYGWSCFSEKFH